jgi:ABC-type transport system substrate-binding protein
LADRYSSSGATNWAGYANATVDKLFAQQASTLDATERQDLVTQLQMTMMEEVASDFTMIMLNRYFYNPKVQSFRVSALNGNAERWDARQTFKTTA